MANMKPNSVFLSNKYSSLISQIFCFRCAVEVKEKTHCLFQALLRPKHRDYYSNPLYERTELAIWPSVHPQSLQLWKGEL